MTFDDIERGSAVTRIALLAATVVWFGGLFRLAAEGASALLQAATPGSDR